MPILKIHVCGDGCWPDLAEKPEKMIHTEQMEIAALPHGMVSGAPSVAFRIDLPDGRVVIAETSLKLLVGATRVLVAKHSQNQ
jgi:hypothetical protein